MSMREKMIRDQNAAREEVVVVQKDLDFLTYRVRKLEEKEIR